MQGLPAEALAGYFFEVVRIAQSRRCLAGVACSSRSAGERRLRRFRFIAQQKRRPKAASLLILAKILQRRFNLKTPSLKKSLRDVF